MRLYIVRHGETDWNQQLRLQGREDIPLNETGIAQANRCGDVLRGLSIDAIYSSPLMRSMDTAKIIASYVGVTKVTEDELIIERDFGKFSGITYAERKASMETDVENGVEPNDVVRMRMIDAVKTYEKNHPGGHVLVVSHGGSINNLLAELSHGEIGTGKTRLKNACISVIDLTKDKAVIVGYNLEPEEFREQFC